MLKCAFSVKYRLFFLSLSILSLPAETFFLDFSTLSSYFLPFSFPFLLISLRTHQALCKLCNEHEQTFHSRMVVWVSGYLKKKSPFSKQNREAMLSLLSGKTEGMITFTNHSRRGKRVQGILMWSQLKYLLFNLSTD